MEKNNRIQLALIIYLIVITIIIVLKPTHMYNDDGSLKEFGAGKKKTLFPLWLLVFLGAFFAYYLSHIIMCIYLTK
jgi:hypothetical protein